MCYKINIYHFNFPKGVKQLDKSLALLMKGLIFLKRGCFKYKSFSYNDVFMISLFIATGWNSTQKS